MKLIIPIVQDEDSSRLLSELMQQGFGVTKLATTGGFLKAGNTTLLLGIDDERLNEAISVIESVCKSRKQISTAPSALVGGMTHGEYSSFPIEVTSLPPSVQGITTCVSAPLYFTISAPPLLKTV